ncbi:Venom prothrombin activator vestarin-D1 [Oryzias melastigma]|uniref:Venom prothrombin activator vestarin-D1 n=1 Tax=Oryzias melastigma TaxID=30732 RepID=A0A834FEV1_ORYME|nr:Venom prothrombin activator vestarin-D1 [Oryzias melastigma]
MCFGVMYASVVCLLLGAASAIQSPQTVFLDKQQATSLISRQKRGTEASTLEQACMERVCTYDEARRFFQDTYRTDIFWSVYIDGDQCAEKPCKNGAMCLDSVGGYDCVCKSGFSGENCQQDLTLCVVEKDKGCSQFCKPGYVSYECSCARGWKLSQTDRNTCVPAVSQPCGKLNSPSVWKSSEVSNIDEVSCSSSNCPWQALLKITESPGYCSGVIIKENLVLTTAECGNKYKDFQVAVGISRERSVKTLRVRVVHLHPRYVEGRPENNLAVIEVEDRFSFSDQVIAACLPEKDFAESVLMAGELPAFTTGWKTSSQAAFQDQLTLKKLEYRQLNQCLGTYPNIMTNKMGCTAPPGGADCSMSSGSPVFTMYRDVFFLTGILSQPEGADCNNGYIFQKVSRHLSWLQYVMGSR